MMLLTKALLVLKMLTAASVAPVAPAAYDECSEAQECGSGTFCLEGVCNPTLNCETASDCPEAPEAYSMVCEVELTCDGSIGTCRLAPGQYDECPEGLSSVLGDSGNQICVAL